jgi:hypothetical protein
MFTTTELAALVETFREAGFGRHQRLAVLYREDPHHGARRFAFIGAQRGWQVKAFGEFEEALRWLSEGAAKPLDPGEQEVPLKVRKRKFEVT